MSRLQKKLAQAFRRLRKQAESAQRVVEQVQPITPRRRGWVPAETALKDSSRFHRPTWGQQVSAYKSLKAPAGAATAILANILPPGLSHSVQNNQLLATAKGARALVHRWRESSDKAVQALQRRGDGTVIFDEAARQLLPNRTVLTKSDLPAARALAEKMKSETYAQTAKRRADTYKRLKGQVYPEARTLYDAIDRGAAGKGLPVDLPTSPWAQLVDRAMSNYYPHSPGAARRDATRVKRTLGIDPDTHGKSMEATDE